MLALKPLAQAALRTRETPVFSRRSDPSPPPKNNGVDLAQDLRFEAGARKREFLQALRVRNAASHLKRLPSPGCSLHAIMRGNYNAWDLVPAVLRIIAPDTLDYLGIATLGFNRRNAAQLIGLLDAGQVKTVDFICSVMYADKEKAVCHDVARQLAARSGRFAAIRCHAKLLLFQTASGQFYVYEGSANLRSCRNIEQFVLTQDQALLKFHRSWIDQVLTQHPYEWQNEKLEQPKPKPNRKN